MKKVLLFYLIVQIALSILFMKNELASDGYLEFGFPFKMYRTINGKVFNNPETGFLYVGFFLNVAVILLFSISTIFLLKKVKRL